MSVVQIQYLWSLNVLADSKNSPLYRPLSPLTSFGDSLIHISMVTQRFTLGESKTFKDGKVCSPETTEGCRNVVWSAASAVLASDCWPAALSTDCSRRESRRIHYSSDTESWLNDILPGRRISGDDSGSFLFLSPDHFTAAKYIDTAR